MKISGSYIDAPNVTLKGKDICISKMVMALTRDVLSEIR